VIHRDRLKSLTLGCGGRCRTRGGGRQSQTAKQLPPVHPALLEVVQKLPDEMFHFPSFPKLTR
jgi:hypothetical protein